MAFSLVLGVRACGLRGTENFDTVFTPGGGGGRATLRVLGRQLPPPPLGGLQLTVSCQRCRPQEYMGAEGAQRCMGTKAAQRKILSNLHPNTILKPNPDPNPHHHHQGGLRPTNSWGVVAVRNRGVIPPPPRGFTQLGTCCTQFAR